MATMEKPKPKQKKKTKRRSEELEECSLSPNVEDIPGSEVDSSVEEKSDHVVSEDVIQSVDNLALEAEQKENILDDETLDQEKMCEFVKDVDHSENVVSCDQISQEIMEATAGCKELSEAVGSIIQPLPSRETSCVQEASSSSKDEVKLKESKNYHELVTNLSSTMKEDLEALNKITNKITAFTLEEVEHLFGVKELEKAMMYASEFEKMELQPPSLTNPLYDNLMEYQRSRSSLIQNQKEITLLTVETSDRLEGIWHLENRIERVGGRCADGCYLEETHAYQVATFQKLFMLEMQKKLSSLREKVTELHSQYSHMEYFLKYKIDDLLWAATVNGIESMRSALRILFFVLRTSGWGYDKTLRIQLRKWCCSLAAKLLQAEDSVENILFLLHHIMRLSRGIKWAFHLINCSIKNWSDISKAMCLLEGIVYAGGIEAQGDASNIQKPRHISECTAGEYDVVVAAEATDDNEWFVVDSDGEGGDLDSKGRGLLTETDILGLLKQIPFEEIFKELMVVRWDGKEMVFCGGNLNGGPILKILASLRIILKILNTGLINYKSYNDVSKELCRLALHCIKYFTDLWEVASINCEANLLERVLIEYNNLFLVTWDTIANSGIKDSIFMFQSEIPCHFVWLETVEIVYNKMQEKLIASDSIGYYYTLVCMSNMAVQRKEEEFVQKIIRKLYEIGFSSDFSEFVCGEWARTLCGTALHSKPHYVGPLLGEMAVPLQPQWLSSLPLNIWKPQAGEVIYLLNQYKQRSPNMIPFLLKGMNWSSNWLDYDTHKAVGLFLIGMNHQLIHPKGQYPEWIWECVLPLRLHMFDWKLSINMIPEPDTIKEIDLTGRCHTSNIIAILMTTWGHSIPLIFQNAGPLLLKLAQAGRFGEVTHAMHYLVPILSECPESISECKNFKELLSILIRNEKTYTKMATRLVAGEMVGPVTKQLVYMIQSQLKYYSEFNLSSPRDMLMVWVYWLTSSEGWQSDWVIIYLLDVAIGSCFLHHPSVSTAATYLAECIQNTTAKSPLSSSTGFSWLWNNNSYKGLVQCSIEAPYVWHATLWTEHSIMERGTGLWQRLVTKLSDHKEGTKVNIDKTLKSVGCSDSSNILVIYRCAQYGVTMNVSHPIFTLIWQLFFFLYFDVSFLQFQDKKPVGHLFFEGMVNSRLLAKIRFKLLEAKTYHEDKVKEFADPSGVPTERQSYHEFQKHLMGAFITWLREDISSYLGKTPMTLLLPFYDKFNALITGNNALWMETVDHFQLKSFQPVMWPQTIIQTFHNHSNRVSEPSQPSFPSRAKSPDTHPSSRIIHRLKSYEQPLTKSDTYGGVQLRPLVDPSIGRDFSVIEHTMKYNLGHVQIVARSYNEMCKSLNSTDNNLSDLLHNLYERRQINRSVMLGCGDSCQGKVQINIQVSDWRRNGEAVRMIDYNRTMYKLSIEDATLPYEDMAGHTAIISKLATMACDRKISNVEENGPRMFNMVTDYIGEDIINFPTAHHTIICFATQLGEKFVTQSGDHFINLVCKVRGPGGAGLVGSLLRPCQLSTPDMIRVYSAISSTVTDYHMAFSYLTKFDIPRWLHNTRPSVPERAKFLNLLFTSLSTAGFDPSDERLILHELMCVHLTKVMAWEFPVHLIQVLTALCNLSLEKKIPPDTWQHCITIIETYPNMLSHELSCECLELVGNLWWSKRGSWGPNGLYNQYGAYCPQMGRLGALLVSTVLSTAMLHNPPLLTKDICAIVMKAIQSFWNVWLCPWWGGGAQASVWVGELCRGPALMPWGTQDDVHPDSMLDALVETILYCATTLPGSLNDLLSITWQWYTNHFPHPAVNPHVMVRIHRALLKLPWTANSAHWLSWQDLRLLFKVTGLNIEICSEFAVKCLGNRSWVRWVEQQPEHSHSMAVQYLLPMLLRLNPSKEVLEDAEYLPWSLMSTEIYEENLNWYIKSFYTGTETLSSSRLLPLFCAAGGLIERSQYTDPWRTKRITLVKSLVNIICNDETPSCVDSVKFLLNRIQSTIDVLENASDSQKYSEAAVILNASILIFNMMRNTILIEKVWCDWFKTASRPCICAMVISVLQINKRDVFASLAEEALLAFFEHEDGDWSFILSNWKDECVVGVDFLLNNKSFLTALATYKVTSQKSQVQSNTIHPIDKAALQSLHTVEIESSYEKTACLWVCYILTIVGDHSLDRANTFAVINQSVSILEQWSQEPAWGLFKAMRLVQNKAPSNRFRLLARFALCFILDYQHKIKDSTLHLVNFEGNLRSKTLNSIESMASQKCCGDIKHIIVKNLAILKEQDCTIKEFGRHIVELCYDLYSNVNYIKKINSLFDSVL